MDGDADVVCRGGEEEEESGWQRREMRDKGGGL